MPNTVLENIAYELGFHLNPPDKNTFVFPFFLITPIS
jgi:hypothetical protein